MVIDEDGGELIDTLERRAGALKIWSKDVFGRIPKQVRTLQKELADLNELEWSLEVKRRKQTLEVELDWVLALEEYYWRQRLRAEVASWWGPKYKTFPLESIPPPKQE